MNYVYEICNYSFRCNVSDNFISEYFHYRFSGFVCEAEISSITDLKIIQRDNVNDILTLMWLIIKIILFTLNNMT